MLLLLHGYSDSSRSFSLLEPYLEGYRLLIPDLPGHGASMAGEGLAVADFADDIAALLLTLGIDRCVVIGHSMGAMIGMVLADGLPGTIEAMILISGTLRPAFPKDDPITQAILRLGDPIDPADPFFDVWHAGPHPVDRSLLDPLSSEAAAIPSRIWHGILDGFSRLDLTEIAGGISQPILCIAGSEDMLFDASHRRALASALPDARSVLLTGFGHNPHWEDPAKVARLVEDFFGQRSSLHESIDRPLSFASVTLERRSLNTTHSVGSKRPLRKKYGAERCGAIGQAIRRGGRPFSANPKGRMNFGHHRRQSSRPQLLLRSSPTALGLDKIPSGRMGRIKRTTL